MTSLAEEATLDNTLTWDTIDWLQAERVVNKLQFRIAKAIK